METYYTSGVCATEINFQVENGIVKYVAFNGGCPGNLTAIQKLLEGMPVEQVTANLKALNARMGHLALINLLRHWNRWHQQAKNKAILSVEEIKPFFYSRLCRHGLGQA